MADSYPIYARGSGPPQAHQFFGHNQYGRTLARTGSPINGARYANDPPSPTRPTSAQAAPHTGFSSYGQIHPPGVASHAGNNHSRYMQISSQHKFSQHSHPQHLNHNNHSQGYGNHNSHGALGHQHSGSIGMLTSLQQGFNGGAMQNNAQDDHEEPSEAYPERWQHQMELAHDARNSANLAHRHSKKASATSLATRTAPVLQSMIDDLGAGDSEAVERHRALALQESRDRNGWDGLDLSGQGLRNMAPCLFSEFNFLTKLYIDNNKLRVLPSIIGTLRHLTCLNVSMNELQELPPDIGMLTKLHDLMLFDNLISHLPDEIGYLQNLTMLGIIGNPLDKETKDYISEHGTQQFIQHIRDKMEGPRPPRPREMVVLDEAHLSEQISVLDWNILCDKYASKQLYGYTPKHILEWSYRQDLIVKDIKRFDADFICLQEADKESHDDFFRPELAPHNYKGLLYQKSRSKTMDERSAKKVDGCAIFWKDDKFVLLEKQHVDFANIAINRADMKGEHDVFNRVMPKDHLGVICFFENRFTGTRMIVVNVHLHWDPVFEDVKIVQTAILMDQLTLCANRWISTAPLVDKQVYRYSSRHASGTATPVEEPREYKPSKRYKKGSDIPVIICGDFNTNKESGIYDLIRNGSLAPDHSDFRGRSYGKFTREGMSHPFKLRSLYCSEDAEEPDHIAFTNYTPGFCGMLDHIWYSKQWRPLKLLGDLDYEYLQTVPGFPNFHFPSDHLALYAEFGIGEDNVSRQQTGFDDASESK